MTESKQNQCFDSDESRSAQMVDPWKGIKVLLVEDNLPNQQLAVVVLRKIGVEVDVAFNGFEAIEALKKNIYNIVFMDLQMPEMDGLEATNIIRSSDSVVLDHEVIIVALTANAFSSDKKNCFKVGMNDYLSKPFTAASLEYILRKYIKVSDSSVVNSGSYEHHSQEAEPDPDELNDELNDDHFDHPVYDHSAFMERVMNDQDIMNIVLDGFLRDMPLQIEILKKLVESGDCKKAGRQAHIIKGASANVGGESLRHFAFFLEKACKNNMLELVKRQIDGIDIEFKNLTDELIKHIGEKESNRSCYGK